MCQAKWLALFVGIGLSVGLAVNLVYWGDEVSLRKLLRRSKRQTLAWVSSWSRQVGPTEPVVEKESGTVVSEL